MIRVSDYIAGFIASHSECAKTIFMVSGGGNMHLIDALGRNRGLRYVCNHNEQACTYAAEGFARLSNRIGMAFVTTGPGGTNAITGVYSAWVDSIPIMVISGQVKFSTTIASCPDLPLRQLGDQEVNIIDLVRPLTKYAEMVADKKSVRCHLERAVYEAKHGRPGPVWLDIPLDVQSALVDEDDLYPFEIPPEDEYDTRLEDFLPLLLSARRPVIIAGNGIRLAGAVTEFMTLAERLCIPVIGTFARYDIVPSDHPLFYGRYGTVGHRMANFIVQNADLVLALGARMNIRAVSYNWEFFAREAKLVAVDVDQAELDKPTVTIDLKIRCDVKRFIDALLARFPESEDRYADWLVRCGGYRRRYPVIDEKRRGELDYVDSYNFAASLSEIPDAGRVYVLGNGTACVATYQSLMLSDQQRVVCNSGCAAMGYDLPAAIGASFAHEKREVVCITGDGSIQMNIQELQTIIHHKLPIKIFVLNNQGYISIRNTQGNFFGGFKVGSDASSGVSFPDILKIASAYGLSVYRIAKQDRLKEELGRVLEMPGPVLCELCISPVETMEPKLSSQAKPDGRIISKPLEDMFPFLDREEFYDNMLVRPVPEE